MDIKEFGYIQHKLMEIRAENEFKINQPQMDKFVELVSFFYKMVDKNDNGEVSDVSIESSVGCGDVTATFDALMLCGEEEVSEFAKVLSYGSAADICGTKNNRAMISVTIPRVFIPEDESILKQKI